MKTVVIRRAQARQDDGAGRIPLSQGVAPQKRRQVALGSDDWSDRLIGVVPHLYIYTIGNVGEAMIAKRRTCRRPMHAR